MSRLLELARLGCFLLVTRLARRRVVVGRGLRLRCWLELDGPGQVTIGDHCTIDAMPGGKREHVTLYTNSESASIVIGQHVLLRSVRVSCKYRIAIGDHALIEDAAIADTDFHSMDPSRVDAEEEPAECRIEIGPRTAIGSRSVICKGVTIGAGGRVIAGSIVRKDVPEGVTVLGNPARPLVAPRVAQ